MTDPFDPENTPIESPSAIRDLSREVRQLRLHTSRLADAAMTATRDIPELRKEIAQVRMWQQWAPLAAITLALAIQAAAVIWPR